MRRIIIIVLVIAIAFSCEDDYGIKKRCNCFKLDCSDNQSFSLVYQRDQECFSKPCFNPLNQDEIICLQSYRDSNLNFYFTNYDIIKYNLKTKVKSVVLKNVLPASPFEWGVNGWILAASLNWQIWLIKDDGSFSKQISFGHWDIYPTFKKGESTILYSDNADKKMRIIDSEGNLLDSFSLPDNEGYSSIFRSCSWNENIVGYIQSARTGQISLAIYNSKGELLDTIIERMNPTVTAVVKDVEWLTKKDFVVNILREGLYVYKDSALQLLRLYCPCEHYGYFTISPDGQKIIAEKSIYTKEGKCSAQAEEFLVIMDIDGRNEERIEIPE